MDKIHLYAPRVVYHGKSFVNSKVHTKPSQSLTLKDIIARFIRREPLPVEKQGVYSTRLGDLEKVQHLDITEKMERVEEIKEGIAKAEKRMTDKKEAAEKAAIEKAARDKLEAELKQKDPQGSNTTG